VNNSEQAPVTVRPATLDDAPHVAALATQLGYPTTRDEIPARLAAVAADPHHTVQVAECRSDVVGWIHVYVRKTLARDGDAEIGGLIVDESYRGRGIGKRLVEQALAWARQKGCHTVIVRSNVVREDTAQFYLGLGFETIKRQAVFRRALDNHQGKLKTDDSRPNADG